LQSWRTYSPISGDEVKKDSVTDVIDLSKKMKENVSLESASQFKKFKDLLKTLKVAGFTDWKLAEMLPILKI
jgi:excinuclease ABC subunit A